MVCGVGWRREWKFPSSLSLSVWFLCVCGGGGGGGGLTGNPHPKFTKSQSNPNCKSLSIPPPPPHWLHWLGIANPAGHQSLDNVDANLIFACYLFTHIGVYTKPDVYDFATVCHFNAIFFFCKIWAIKCAMSSVNVHADVLVSIQNNCTILPVEFYWNLGTSVNQASASTVSAMGVRLQVWLWK